MTISLEIRVPYYLHAPAVGLYFVGATLVGLAKLQEARPIRAMQIRIIVSLSIALSIGFSAEALYYLIRSISDSNFTAPQHAAVRCLGAMLLWVPVSATLVQRKSLVWHPYVGTFVAQFGFEGAICLLHGFSLSPKNRYGNAPLAFSVARSIASFLLVVNGLVVQFQKDLERGTDDEAQPLLSGQADESDEIHKRRINHLKEQGGWFGYLKSFMIFLPQLWPRNDRKVMFCLFLRFLNFLQSRVLNLLEPRQLGIITNRLSEGSHVMPWGDIGKWILFRWINSYCGFCMVDNIANTVISETAGARITTFAYEHLMSLSMDFHATKDTGDVLKGVEQASSLNTLVTMVLFDVFPILLDLVIALCYSTHLFNAYMGFVILFMAITHFWLTSIFATISKSRRRTYTEKKRVESTTVNETVADWSTVAYFNREQHETTRYEKNVQTTIQAYYSYHFRTMGGFAAQDLLTTLGFAAAFVFAISQIISNDKPVGNLITLIVYWDSITNSLHAVSQNYRQTTKSLIDAERLVELLNTKPTIVDCDDARDLVVENGTVEFQDVDFAYDPRKQIIKKANFKVQGGQTAAFVGETGGGKSTILKLLFRSYDVASGSISIDGQGLRAIKLSSLRDSLGLVPQTPGFFNRTVRDNVRYAKLDATDAEVEEACRAAAIHDDIVSFPDGYNSKVGERGVCLSGGQLQRLAIARVLLKNPKIVLLDEATSAIDSVVEAKIQQAFKELSKGRTTFIMAHRLSTIMEANQIFVIDKGEIIERGTHSEPLSFHRRVLRSRRLRPHYVQFGR